MADAIAGEGEVAVGGVLLPGLVAGVKEGFDLLAGSPKEGAEDRTLGKGEDGVDARETLGPCSAEEFGEDGFGLVVEGVRGGDGVERHVAEELAEPGVAQAAGRAFDGVGGEIVEVGWGGSLRSAAGFSGGIDAGLVKEDAEF